MMPKIKAKDTIAANIIDAIDFLLFLILHRRTKKQIKIKHN